MNDNKNQAVPEEKATAYKEEAHTFLAEAAEQMMARAKLRDTNSGERTAGRIADVFNRITGHRLTEADAWMFLVVMKIIRSRGGSYNRDDYVDLAAYASLLGEHESESRQ